MSKKKHCYEYTKHRQYKCCECGRTMHKPTPTNISYSVDMDKDKFDDFAVSFRLYDESIKLGRDIDAIIQAYAKKRQKKLGNPLYYLYYKVNRALTYFAIFKQRKKIFGI